MAKSRPRELSLNGDLRFDNTSSIIKFGGDGGSISSDEEGDIHVSEDLVVFGHVWASTLHLPVPSGNLSITATDLGIAVDGIIIKAATGITFPSPDRNKSINVTTEGITVDGINIGVNTGIRFPIPGGTRTILAESQGITINGNVTATAFNTGSDRNLKEQFSAIDAREILERVVRLPISSWKFKEDAATRHIGPMAQDFYAAFGVGADERHIATVDADGVALAAVQGLNQKLNERDAEIQTLKSQNESLEKRLTNLELLIKSGAGKNTGEQQ